MEPRFKTIKTLSLLRNKIVHDVDADEDSLCKKSDEIWIYNFTKRITSNNDPLSLYKQSKKKSINKLLIVLLIIILLFIYFAILK